MAMLLDSYVNDGAQMKSARKTRRHAWTDNGYIPSWVDVDDVDFDRFFTLQHVARSCYDDLRSAVVRDHVDADEYHYVEPGVGGGGILQLTSPESKNRT